MLLLLLFSSELTFNFVTSLISPCSISLIFVLFSLFLFFSHCFYPSDEFLKFSTYVHKQAILSTRL